MDPKQDRSIQAAFDGYVTIDDYRRDTAEVTSRAAGIIDEMKRSKRAAERMLIAAVLASGGKLTVHGGHLHNAETAILQIERDEANDAIILTARR